MQLGSLIELNCYTEEGCICHIVFEILWGKDEQTWKITGTVCYVSNIFQPT